MNDLRDLPDGWSWANFDDVAKVASNLVDPAAYQDLPHIAPNHIQSNTGILLPYRTIAEDGVISLKHLFRPGQVLYSKIRPYLAKAAYATFDGLCSADMYPIETDLNPKYLLYWLLTGEFTRSATLVQGRTVLPKINRTQLGKLPVPVAPSAEQERIVAVIEEELSHLETGIVTLNRAQRNLSALSRAIILSAVPETYPEDWIRVTVAEAGEVTLGRQRAPRYHNGPKMRPYLRVANVFEDRIDTDDVMSMHFDDEEYERYKLIPGDILLNEGQSPHLLGRPAMYRGDPPGSAFTKSLLRFRAGPHVLPGWALLVFRRHMHAKRFMRESKITTNIAHLTEVRFKTVEFPLPPMDEQKLIVASVEDNLSEVSRMKAVVSAQRARTDRLRSSILTAAFSGQLVSRDEAAE